MTTLIIEDEIPASRRLEQLLNKNGFVVFVILHSVKIAVEWLKNNNHPDLIFMDIKLRDNLCFKIFEEVDIKSKIIFTTAFDEFALKAFEYNSLDYLLKPIDEKKLEKLISKLSIFQSAFHNNEHLKNIKLQTQSDYKTSFLVSIGSVIRKVETKEIICFFSNNNTTYIFSNQNRLFPIDSSLEKLEKDLDINQFFRISRKLIINREYISAVKKEKIETEFLIENIDLKISRLKLKSFMNWYK
ncbi:LytTR family DNA-binding domain-containing protein [Flavobacterium sp. FBOR7N2.3]|uniref:LytTR family DNA-binding domain-containing protein n=1 Tax=Flavobacterium magnesitis TaxID=3138077 RepID=A0ABV4TNP2_9FLAO